MVVFVVMVRSVGHYFETQGRLSRILRLITPVLYFVSSGVWNFASGPYHNKDSLSYWILVCGLVLMMDLVF